MLAIIICITALLTPVIARARRSSQIASSVSNLKQLYVSLQIYRTENDGVDGVYDYYALALPTRNYFNYFWHAKDRKLWPSPCGYVPLRIAAPGVMGVQGEIYYASPTYDPELFRTGSNLDLKDYLQTYKDNAVVLIDIYCNDAEIDTYAMRAPFIKKRALAALLSGQIVNKIKEGNALSLPFYSDLP